MFWPGSRSHCSPFTHHALTMGLCLKELFVATLLVIRARCAASPRAPAADTRHVVRSALDPRVSVSYKQARTVSCPEASVAVMFTNQRLKDSHLRNHPRCQGLQRLCQPSREPHRGQSLRHPHVFLVRRGAQESANCTPLAVAPGWPRSTVISRRRRREWAVFGQPGLSDDQLESVVLDKRGEHALS